MDFCTALNKLIGDVCAAQKTLDLDHLLTLATSCKTAIKTAKSHLVDCRVRRSVLQQLQFADRIVSGLVEALRREQKGVQIKEHLENVLAGLTRLQREMLRSSVPVQQPAPGSREDLRGSDWQAALQTIRIKLSDGVMQEQIKIPDTLDPEDMRIINNLSSVAIEFLTDQPYGLITAPVFIVQGRIDNTARSLLAKENYDYHDFMQEYFVIDNASILGVLASMHTTQFVNEALRYVNHHHKKRLSLCGPTVKEEDHFYYLLMPERAVLNRNANIHQWIFQKAK